MIKIYTNLSELNIFSSYNFTIVNQDAKCDIAVIEDHFSIVENIYEVSPECLIIFIASHYHYINDALNKHLFAYHVKPVNKELLQNDIHKMMMTYAKRNKKCLIHANNQHIIISNHDLIYFTSSYKELKIMTKNNTYYTHINNKKILLSFIESLDFIQISKSTYINKDAVISYGHNSLLLVNGEKYFLSS